MTWPVWLFHLQTNPVFLIFGKFFQTPFDIALHWIFVTLFVTFLIKLLANALLFTILDPEVSSGRRHGK